MDLLAAAYPWIRVSDATRGLYTVKLCPLPHKECAMAIGRLVDSSARFPSIAEIREECAAVVESTRAQESTQKTMRMLDAPPPGKMDKTRLVAYAANVFTYTTGRISSGDMVKRAEAIEAASSMDELERIYAEIECDLRRPAAAVSEVGNIVGAAAPGLRREGEADVQ